MRFIIMKLIKHKILQFYNSRSINCLRNRNKNKYLKKMNKFLIDKQIQKLSILLISRIKTLYYKKSYKNLNKLILKNQNKKFNQM